jgi:hypothetical protein
MALVWSVVSLLAAVLVVGISAPARAESSLGASAVSEAASVPAASRAVASAPAVGTAETFWALDWGEDQYMRTRATLRWVGEHVAVYVADDALLGDTRVQTLGTAFDSAIYPTLTQAYGAEPFPGIDGDPRVTILIYDFKDRPAGSIQGSFNPWDIDPLGRGVTLPWGPSNEREMFYLNLQAIYAEPGNMGALAAHEFAHLILHYRGVMLDPSPDCSAQEAWIVEGLTTYAEHLCGYSGRADSLLRAFTLDPDLNLTLWRLGERGEYGASYAFVSYLATHFGPDLIRALVEEPRDGASGIDAVLRAQGHPSDFKRVFDRWVVACYLDGRDDRVQPYSFDGIAVAGTAEELSGTQPILGGRTVTNYGAVYLDFPRGPIDKTFKVVIDGADGAPLRAALISRDSRGVLLPVVRPVPLAAGTTGGSLTTPAGYDLQTLVVWARGLPEADADYEFKYVGAYAPPADTLFLDMCGDDPYYPHVAKLLQLGIINGKEIPLGSGLFFYAGEADLWRAQFAKMMMEATGLHTPEIDNLGRPTFKDVPLIKKGDSYDPYPYDYVEEAAAAGVIKGYGNGDFGPYRSVTRGQTVAMIVRAAAAVGRPFPASAPGTRVFADVGLGHPFYDELTAAYTAGLITGESRNGRLYFDPYSQATRNHVAQWVARFACHLEGSSAP